MSVTYPTLPSGTNGVTPLSATNLNKINAAIEACKNGINNYQPALLGEGESNQATLTDVNYDIFVVTCAAKHNEFNQNIYATFYMTKEELELHCNRSLAQIKQGDDLNYYSVVSDLYFNLANSIVTLAAYGHGNHETTTGSNPYIHIVKIEGIKYED